MMSMEEAIKIRFDWLGNNSQPSEEAMDRMIEIANRKGIDEAVSQYIQCLFQR